MDSEAAGPESWLKRAIAAQAPGFSEQMWLLARPLGSVRERYFWLAILAPEKREGLRSLMRTRLGAGGARFLVPARGEGPRGWSARAPEHGGPFLGAALGP